MKGMDPQTLLAELIAIPGPPGQEEAVRKALEGYVSKLGYAHSTDAKGNLLVPLSANPPKVVVTAHMDENAMIVREVRPDGSLKVGPLGGVFPWKLGEGPVQILARKERLDAVMSFGSIHTEDPTSTVRKTDKGAPDWSMVQILTGLSAEDLDAAGVRPGTRVVIGPQRRTIVQAGHLISGFFFDDRADLVSWLLALEALKGQKMDVLFVASSAEEVGGEGALYVLQKYRPDVCVALELGPDVEDARVDLSDQPTVWVNDSYSAPAAADVELLADLGKELGMQLQFQALSRGGSDASCAAHHGLCGRPFTLGLPMQNSHGFEVMHPGAMQQLARLAVALLGRLTTV
jgi:putative aminopeptidase FrvX